MKILNILRQNGVNIGVTIEDVGEERYPIPWKGLYARVIFESLLSSGYELIDAEKGEFEFEGLSTFSLPVIDNWQPTMEEKLTFDNYDVDESEMVPITELVAKQKMKASVILREPRHDYTIKTREEFLAYIDALSHGVREDDFLPINYFVAPEARFTLLELATMDVATTAMCVLEKRRKLSIQRAIGLTAWLAEMFPNVTDFTASRICELYNKWDVDGVYIPYTAVSEVRTEKDPIFKTVSVQGSSSEFYYDKFKKYVPALNGTDIYDVVYPPFGVSESYKNHRPYIDGDSNQNVIDRHKALGPGEYTACRLVVPYEASVIKITPEGNRFAEVVITEAGYKIVVSITQDDPTLSKPSTNRKVGPYFGLRIADPMNANKVLPSYYFEVDADRIDLYCKVRALTNKLLRARTTPCDDTSYKILIDYGYSPTAAVEKIAVANNMLNNFVIYDFDSEAPLNEQFDYSSVQDSEDGGERDLSGIVSIAHGFTSTDVRNFFMSSNGDNRISDTLSDLDEVSLDKNTAALKCAAIGGRCITATCIKPDQSTVSVFGVNVYCETKKQDIMDIMSGGVDMGLISSGRMKDMQLTENQEVFDNLLNSIIILGISYEEVEQTVDAYVSNGCQSDIIKLTKDGMTVVVDVPLINNAAMAAAEERRSVAFDTVSEAPTFFKVIDVATELSNSENIHKAVGIYGVACDALAGKVDRKTCDHVMHETSLFKVLTEMEDAYYTLNRGSAILSKTEDMKLHIKASEAARYVVLTTFQFGGTLGETVKDIPEDWKFIAFTHPDWWEAIKENSRTFTDSTIAIADGMFDPYYPGYPMYHCLNAIVRPTEVEMIKSFVAHETYLRAVYDMYYVEEYYNDLVASNLVMANSYFNYANDQLPSWDAKDSSVDGSNHHLDNNERGYMYGANMWSTGECKVYKDHTLYSYMRNPDVIPVTEDKLPRIKFIIESSLYRYYKDAYKWLDEHPNERMLAPVHPAEAAYKELYYEEENHIVIPRTEGERAFYGPFEAHALVGPAYVDDGSGKISGLAIRQNRIGDSSRIIASVQKTEQVTLEKVTGFTSEELQYDYSLGRYFFSDPNKKPLAVVGHFIYTSNEDYIMISQARTLDASTYNVYFIDTLELSEVLIYDIYGALWRVKYDNR